MSWNRAKYDSCAYNKDLSQSTSSISYLLDPNKFYNCNDCRIEFGLLGGNNTSITRKNMVDLESDLRNQTRQLSNCPERQYLPYCEACDNNEGMPCGSASCKLQQDFKHLRACNIVQYAPRIDHVGYDLRYPGCPSITTTSADGQKMDYPPQYNPIQWKGAVNSAQWVNQQAMVPEVYKDPAVPRQVVMTRYA